MPGPMNGPWTPARKEQAASLWTSGSTASEIARTLGGGLSRNAVIGVITRMGLQRGLPASPAKAKVQRPSTPRPVVGRGPHDPKAAKPPTEVVVFEPACSAGAKFLMALTERCCRFPVGAATGADQLFCARARPEGEVYCRQHKSIASGGLPDMRRLKRRA